MDASKEKISLARTGHTASKQVDALQRMLKILEYLILDRKVTVKELAEEFGVTPRTIQGYVDKRLSHLGVQYGQDHCLEFSHPVRFKQTRLDKKERHLLALSLEQVENIDEEHQKASQHVAEKIYVDDVESSYYIKPEIFQPVKRYKDLVADLEYAIGNHYEIEIEYKGDALTLFPYKIVSFEGIWYLLADGVEEESLKNFMLSHIGEWRVKNIPFEPILDLEEKLEEMNSGHYVEGRSFEVIVRVYGETAEYFHLKDHLESQKILGRYADGSLKISFDVSHEEDIDNLIKSWLPDIEVLSPADFRNRVNKELASYLEKTEKTELSESLESSMT